MVQAGERYSKAGIHVPQSHGMHPGFEGPLTPFVMVEVEEVVDEGGMLGRWLRTRGSTGCRVVVSMFSSRPLRVVWVGHSISVPSAFEEQ